MKITFSRYIFLVLAVFSAFASYALKPTTNLSDSRPALEFSDAIPESFGQWRQLKISNTQIIDPQLQNTLDNLYSQLVTRTYVNQAGYGIMLSMAYGKTQRADLQLHHPEVCYPAQGFAVTSNKTGHIDTGYGPVDVRRLETQLNNQRHEPVTYWALVGDKVVLSSVKRKIVEMKYGFHNQIADGLLFRVSSVDQNTEAAFNAQAAFIKDLLEAVPPEHRRRLAGL